MPKNPIDHFKEICTIPHGSFNEKALSDYIVKFAQDLGLWVRQDHMSNVIIKKPGTSGYENSPAVMIQGHIDMVCQKNEGTEHDFEKDGLKTIIDGDFIRADRTTLGADDCVHAALVMSLLESEDIPHPPIEAIFTTVEEVGLQGAMALSTDDLKGKTLINIDTGNEGEFCSSCSGAIASDLTIPIKRENVSGYVFCELKLFGLKGGHSAVNIHEERGNSNVLLCRTLNIILRQYDMLIAQLNGGDKGNAIPREASAVIAVKEGDFEAVEALVNNLDNSYKTEYRVSDPAVSLTMKKHPDESSVLDNASTNKVINTILSLPNGVLAKSMEVEGLTETSNNIGIIRSYDSEVIIHCFTRSAVESRKKFAFDLIRATALLVGARVEKIIENQPWEIDPNSNIRKICVETYEELYGKATVSATHGGLECGVFIEKMGKIDCVSFGPNIYGAHTPEEKLSISSLDRTWEFLKAVLKKMN